MVLVLGATLDLLAGDPPNRWHPVAWIGRLVALGRCLAPRSGRVGLRIYGAWLVVLVGLGTGAGALLTGSAISLLPRAPALLLGAWLLKLSLSLRGLAAAVELVRGHLVADDLVGARRQLGWHLVSRPTADLDAGAVASGAVESLAENLTDGLVAPVSFYVLGSLLGGVGAGLAAAWAYRAVNTADSMIGYREGALTHLGCATARTDDVLNYVPARLAAWFLVAGAWLARQSAAGAARVLKQDGRLTDSPNAGRTMAAMAGAINVSLGKHGHYRLGVGPPPDLDAIDRAVRVYCWAAAFCLAVAALLLAAVS